MALIEGNVVQSGLLLGNHSLDTDGVVFIDVEIINMNLAIIGDSSKYSGTVRSPGYISNLSIEVKHEQWFTEIELIC